MATGGRPGRHGRTNEAARLLGNPSHRKMPNPVSVIALPRAALESVPEEDMTDGQRLVRDLLEAGATAWISNTDQMVTLTMLGVAWDERAKLRAFIEENGHSYVSYTQTGIRHYAYPEVRDLRDVEAQITTWLSELGLTPIARSKLGVAEVKSLSKLEQMRDRRAARKIASG